MLVGIRSLDREQKLYTEKGWWKDEVLCDIVDRQSDSVPDKVAVIDRQRQLTYRDLAEQSKQLAAGFQRLGIKKGDLVALQLPNWSEFALAVIALSRIGAMFTQIGIGFREREVEFILRYSGAKGIIIPQKFHGFDHLSMVNSIAGRLPDLQHTIVVGSESPHEAIDYSHLLDTRYDEDQLAVTSPHGDDLMRMVFTSGTTGDPKAVLHTYNTTLAVPRITAQRLGMDHDMIMMIFLPLGLNWAFLNLMEVFYNGATAVLIDKFDPRVVLQTIEEHKVTHFCTAPTALIAMLNHRDFGKYDLKSIRYIISGGASCPVEVIRQVVGSFPGHFLELYGMLETGVHTCTSPDDDPLAVAGSVGTCLEGMELRIVDDDGKDLPPGQPGEIAARGPSVALGYYNRPDVNAAAFTPDGWFFTGDIALIDENGLLRIVDRKKELIIRGGANIYPREVEEILFTHPDILQVAVIGIPDQYLGEKTCACVVPRNNKPLTLSDITSFLEGKIAKYKWPERLEIFDELPLTPTGKVQKFALRQLVVERDGDGQDVVRGTGVSG